MVLPVPGDVRGLAAGTQFEHDALAAGEAVIVANPEDPGSAVGLVPEFSYGDVDEAAQSEPLTPELCALSWMVYSLPGAPVLEHYELGDAEYALRSAVRSAAEALSTIGLGSSDVANPRGLVEQLLESSRQHRVPDHAPSRALRVLENAAHVDAIIAVSAGLSRLPIGTQSLSDAQRATDALRPLTAVVRSADVRGHGDPALGLAGLTLATQCGGRHGWPLMLDRQPGTGSGPLTRAGIRP